MVMLINFREKHLNDVQDILSDLFFLFGGVIFRGGKFLKQCTWPRNSRQYLGEKNTLQQWVNSQSIIIFIISVIN